MFSRIRKFLIHAKIGFYVIWGVGGNSSIYICSVGKLDWEKVQIITYGNFLREYV